MIYLLLSFKLEINLDCKQMNIYSEDIYSWLLEYWMQGCNL